MTASVKMKNIPIVFAIDGNYCGKLAVVVSSILQNSKKSFDFYILTTGISHEDADKLQRIINRLSIKSKLYMIDPSKFIEENLEGLMARRSGYTYISVETYYRFYIHKVLPYLDKAIYLDADILVLGDIASLYCTDLKGAYAGVVSDIYIHFICQKEKNKTQTRPELSMNDYIRKVLGVRGRDYFNAGVLLLNLKKLRDDKVDERLLHFARKFSPLEFQDQDALNAVFGSNVVFLDLAWNVIKNAKDVEGGIININYRRDLRAAFLKPKIVHYTGSNKPWCLDIFEYDYLKEWWEVYFSTGFCTDEDRARYTRILSTERFKLYEPFVVLKLGKFELLHIYRENFRYKFIFLGKLVCRKTMKCKKH